MMIPIDMTNRIDNNYRIGDSRGYQSRAAEKLPKTPAVQDAVYEGRDGRNIIFSADGDSAEFYDAAIPPETHGSTSLMLPPDTPGGTAAMLPEYGAVLYNQDGDSAQLSFNPADREDELLPASATPGIEDPKPCETCESRKYVDGSDDPSVSFKTPTKLSSGNAAAQVAAHENEHVHNERRAAEREDRKITHQSVTFHYDTCPECGKQYIAGGTTRTRSVSDPEEKQEFNKANEDSGKEQNSGEEQSIPVAS